METKCRSKGFDFLIKREQDDIYNALVVEERIAREPESWEALDAKADILCSMKMYGLALQTCEMSLRQNPINALAFITKGDALYGLGRYLEAADCYSKAMEIEPLFIRACYIKKRTAEKAILESDQPNIKYDQLQLERDRAREDAESLRSNLDNLQAFLKLKDEEIAFLRSYRGGRTNKLLSRVGYETNLV
jgi:tetratricopeptide (TPR) repeat protein